MTEINTQLTLPESPEKKREPVDHWSEGGMIFFTGGYGYIIKRMPDGELKTVCNGPEEKPQTPPQTPPKRQKACPKNKSRGRPVLKIPKAKRQIILGQGTLREKSEKTGVSKTHIARLLNDQVDL